MATDKFSQLELKSLRLLNLLLSNKSMTATAEVLSMHPPTVTYHLNKLRKVFDDPLLVPKGRELVLTPFSERIRPGLEAALLQLQEVVNIGDFCLAEAEGKYRIAVQDLGAITIAPKLLTTLRNEAPKLCIEFVGWPHDIEQKARDGEIDIAIGAIKAMTGELHGVQLVDMPFRLVMRQGHPIMHRTLSTEDVFDYPHVRISPTGVGEGYVDDLAVKLGKVRQVVLVTPLFSLLPDTLNDSDCLAIIPAGAASKLAEQGLATLPFEAISPVATYCYWHKRMHHDKAHQYLRKKIIELSELPLKDSVLGKI